MARFMMLTTMSQQTSVPDAVQGTTPNPNALPLSVVDAYSRPPAMGLSKQTEPRAQEPRTRRSPTPAMGTELYSERHGGHPTG
jgi:hypothetical protein